jgi:alpha-D-xyloside xylohydrolase
MRCEFLIFVGLLPVFSHAQAVKGYKSASGGVQIALSEGTLGIRPLSENAVRIQFSKNTESKVPELVFSSDIPAPAFCIADSPKRLKLIGQNIVVTVDKQSGTLSCADPSGKVFLREKTGTRSLTPDSVGGEPCFSAEQSFESPDDETLFGLGQFQDGHFNVRNVTRRLTQVNSQIAIPFVYSNKGYGLLWHQYGLTDFNPADRLIALEKQERSASGNDPSAEVTTVSGAQRVSQNQSLYTGRFSVPEDGVYSLFLDLGDMDNRHLLIVDGQPRLDQSNFWLPPTAGALVDLTRGEHGIQVVCKSSNTPKVSWKRIDRSTTFRSPNAKLLDYVVFYGPSADTVIAAYRRLSGNVPMLPLWAYGFWQCRERYTSGSHLVETVGEFRRRNLPMDVIVQDWQYWGKYGWGVPKFDESNYPDPAGFIRELHDLNAHFSVSVWENPDKNSEIGRDYAAQNLFIPGSPWVDVFNPLARETHWNALNKNLFAFGVDSWWMDATEPENDGLKGKRTHLGPGEFYRLTYPLFVSRAVYEGQRKTSSGKRVCILTRSAFLGQQKYGTINWSGDIGGTWDAYRRQIVAGLNYSVTGLPFWTTDIGGFFRPGKTQYTDEKYQELLIRWFQWGAFNPIFRVHGFQSETEPWKYGPRVEECMRKMLNLRYRLLPYIYSEAWQITRHGFTLMRPLVMDFREDVTALNRPFEYMFGKAFCVAPITEPNEVERDVYLPKTAGWFDFWTGKRYDGGQTMTTAAPLETIPLFVKAGSIVPMGKFIQYAGQKSSDTLEIRVYPGADGIFELYEDENDNYDYEKGMFSTVEFRWNESARTLAIGERRGEYPGMLKKRIFNIVLVSPGHGTGEGVPSATDKVVFYDGSKQEEVLP